MKGQEGSPAADDQAGREQREHREHRERHAHGADRPEPAGAVDLGQRQAQQGDDHGRAGPHHGGSGPPQRLAHRLHR
jgi:hypothetical protein